MCNWIEEFFYIHNANVHSYPTRHSMDFHLTNPKIVLAQKSIRHNGPDVWNSLLITLKLCTTLVSFKVKMKEYLLIRYEN